MVDPWVKHAYRAGEGICAVINIVLNSLVLIAIRRNKHLHTPGNVFIAHLSAADICVGVFVGPMAVIEQMKLRIDFYPCVFINTLMGLFTCFNVIMLVCVSIERFVAIRFPFVYEKKVDVKSSMYYAGLAWVIGIILGLVPLYGWNCGIENYKGKCQYTAVISRNYMVYKEGLIMYLVPMVTITCIYTYIWRVVKRHKRRDSVRFIRFNKKEVKSSRSKHPFVKICFAFFLFRGPLVMFDVLAFNKWDHIFGSSKIEVLFALIIFKRLNSIVNPFIYAGTNSKIRRAVLNIVHCRPTTDDRSSLYPTSCTETKYRNTQWARWADQNKYETYTSTSETPMNTGPKMLSLLVNPKQFSDILLSIKTSFIESDVSNESTSPIIDDNTIKETHLAPPVPIMNSTSKTSIKSKTSITSKTSKTSTNSKRVSFKPVNPPSESSNSSQ